MNHRLAFLPWLLILLLLPVVLYRHYLDALPSTSFMTVSALHISDAPAGTSPEMTVKRSIHWPFVGEWNNTLRHRTPEGFVSVCTSSGVTGFHPDNALPRPLTLDHWMRPGRCILLPGDYRLDTVWSIHSDGYPEKFLRGTSNVFTIHPPPLTKGPT